MLKSSKIFGLRKSNPIRTVFLSIEPIELAIFIALKVFPSPPINEVTKIVLLCSSSPGFLYKYFRLERIDLNDSEIPDFGLLITTKGELSPNGPTKPIIGIFVRLVISFNTRTLKSNNSLITT